MKETLSFTFGFTGPLAGYPAPDVRIYVDVPGTNTTTDDVEVSLKRGAEGDAGATFKGTLELPEGRGCDRMWFEAKFAAAAGARWSIAVECTSHGKVFSSEGTLSHALDRFWGMMRCGA